MIIRRFGANKVAIETRSRRQIVQQRQVVADNLPACMFAVNNAKWLILDLQEVQNDLQTFVKLAKHRLASPPRS